MPRIIGRAEWGARHDNGAGAAPLPAEEVWLHHSVTNPTGSPATDVRAIEAIGEQRFGRGISYTFLVHPDGSIFEGHGVDRVGSHTAGRNTRARAICLIGNYEILVPTEEQVDAVVWLLVEGVRRRWWWQARLNGGHRDLKQTACPGDHAYAAIPEINRRAAGGAPAPADDQEDDDDMPRPDDDIDEFRWPNGAVVKLQRDGGVRCYGLTYRGSVPHLKPQHRKGWKEAGAIRPINPQRPESGYIVYGKATSHEFRFDAKAKKFLAS